MSSEELSAQKMRELLNKQFGLDKASSRPDEWVKPLAQDPSVLQPGVVLVANPEPFYDPRSTETLERFNLAEPIPRVIPEDRQADLLPCVLIVQHGSRGTVGLVLNRRTGMLMGDLGTEMSQFMIQPIFLGGTEGPQSLSFLHTYPEVAGAQAITEDGLCFGGEFKAAADLVENGTGSSFLFRFFVQYCSWAGGDLAKELKQRRWQPVQTGKMSIIRHRDKRGSEAAPPMWKDLVSKAAETQSDLQSYVKHVYRSE